jgi:DNL zinc finger
MSLSDRTLESFDSETHFKTHRISSRGSNSVVSFVSPIVTLLVLVTKMTMALFFRLHQYTPIDKSLPFINMNVSAKFVLLLFWLGLSTDFVAAAFYPTMTTTVSKAAPSWPRRASYSDHNSDERSTTDNNNTPEMPLLLPGTGATASSSSTTPSISPKFVFDPFDTRLDAGVSRKQEIAFVASRKFELQYTCKICETRNCHRVSRAAYTNGVVIAQCKGCKTQHLIADHLGFTQIWKKEKGDGATIEEVFAKQQGQGGTGVNRVSREVFDLEKILSHDSSSGSILDENGNTALE